MNLASFHLLSLLIPFHFISTGLAAEEVLEFMESALKKSEFKLSKVKRQLDPVVEILKLMKDVEDSLYPNRCWKRGYGTITPFRMKLSTGVKRAWCDTETDGGGWILFQRHVNGLEPFNRTWQDYKKGFGTPYGDFWLGNDALHELTARNTWKLRIDGEYRGRKYYGVYKSFKVSSESQNYKLILGESQIGTGGFRQLKFHVILDINNMEFTTIDQDNDERRGENCAHACGGGGFWYKSCAAICPNAPPGDGMVWWAVTGWHGSMDSIELRMKEFVDPHIVREG